MAEAEDELGHLHVGYGAVLRGKPSLQLLSDRAALPEEAGEAGEAGDHRPPIGLPFNRVVINR